MLEAQTPQTERPHLIPVHRNRVDYTSDSPQDRLKERKEFLRQAPELETLLRADLKIQLERRGEIDKLPEFDNINLSLKFIEQFRRLARETQDFRKIWKKATDPNERLGAAAEFGRKKKEMNEYMFGKNEEGVSYGPSFEKSYRKYIDGFRQYLDFEAVGKRINYLEEKLEEPSFATVPDQVLDSKARSRVERHMSLSGSSVVNKDEVKEILESLKYVYPENSEEYRAEKEKILATVKASRERPMSKKEMQEELDKLQDREKDLWAGGTLVKYFWERQNFQKLLDDFGEGKPVLELPSVIHLCNELYEMEKRHDRTTIGAILVGEPGVGKTTGLHHYLESRGRRYVYIDLSQDVTRYMLLGSKERAGESSTERFKNMADQIRGMDDRQLQEFVVENANIIESVFRAKKGPHEDGMSPVASLITSLGIGFENLKEDQDLSTHERSMLDDAQEKLARIADKSFVTELGHDFSTTIKKNGWRDGTVIAALRRGESIIFDEFVKARDWSALYSLITTRPGSQWFFADNNEHIYVPEHWRMYFTANIGQIYGGAEVAIALASRAGETGLVRKVTHPSYQEEMMVALSAISNGEGDILRSTRDLLKLDILISSVFPKVRDMVKNVRQSVPISYRSIRGLGEELIQYRDPKTKNLVYRPTETSFDEAAFRVLTSGYTLFNTEATVKNILDLATEVGLFLDGDRAQNGSVYEKVAEIIGETEFDKRKKEWEKPEKQKMYDDAVKTIQGKLKNMALSSMPVRSKIN